MIGSLSRVVESPASMARKWHLDNIEIKCHKCPSVAVLRQRPPNRKVPVGRLLRTWEHGKVQPRRKDDPLCSSLCIPGYD